MPYKRKYDKQAYDREHRHAYYMAHRDKILASQKDYRENRQGSRKDYLSSRRQALRAKVCRTLYGTDQTTACAVCKKDFIGTRGPVIDHDHKTKKWRGILCHRCNLAIGLLDDDPRIALAIYQYLQQFQRKLKEDA